MNKKYTLLSMLMAPAFIAQANNNMDSIQQSLMSSNYYQEECYIKPISGDFPVTLGSCSDYMLLNMTNLTDAERTTLTGNHFGLGISSPYVLINHPQDEHKQVITSLDNYDAQLVIKLINESELFADQIRSDVTPVATSSRSRRSVSSYSGPSTSASQMPTSYSWKFRKVFNLNRGFWPTKDDVAILEYEVEAFSARPVIGEQGNDNVNNSKYIRVTLVGGAGINFNPTEGSSYKRLFSNKPSHQLRLTSYREYLDKVKIGTSWNDNRTEVYDSFPKNNDQDRSGLTYESTISFGVGVSIPKVPIKSLDFSSSKSLTFTNGRYFEYEAETGRNSHSVLFKNKEYGSAYSKHDGYCNLIGDAKGCWKYDNSTYTTFQAFDLLANTPYSNGYRPDYSVTYRANRNVTGSSVLSIDTQIQGLSLQGFNKWYIGNLTWFGVNSAGGYGADYNLNVYGKNSPIKLIINWDSPVFSGVEPSVITAAYGSDETAQCLTAQSDNGLVLADCQPSNESQLFVYTKDRRLVYIADNNLCLDSSAETLQLMRCQPYANNSQTWNWALNSGYVGVNDNAVLYTSTSDNTFRILNPAGSEGDDIPVLAVDSLSQAVNELPGTKFNTQKGRYQTTAITLVK